jgi:hypothetical protein
MKFNVTYEIVTPESAENGDFEETGFELKDATLREAVGIVGRRSCEDSGRWFTQADGSTDYRTGANTRYSLHPPDSITASSYARLRRILC